MLRKLRVEADDDVEVNDDHFDAVVCALTGVLPDEFLLQGLDLKKEIRRRLEEIVCSHDRTTLVAAAPIGYALIRKPIPNVPLRLRFEERFVPECEGVTRPAN